jgi:hypothetical protein
MEKGFAAPEVPDDQRASTKISLRWEDYCQDGRVQLMAMPLALGEGVWRACVSKHPLRRIDEQQIVPVLTRMVVEGTQAPASIGRPVQVQGCFELAHTLDDQGGVRHLLLNMFASLSAERARLFGPPPERAGEIDEVGRVWAEHVFTRPFAPRQERKVLSLSVPGIPALPERVWPWRELDAVLALPPGARALDESLIQDGVTIAFGLEHSDANQHVNSMVYPRVFIDAALRHLARHGIATSLLARRIEVVYKKPFFAGERARIAVRVFATEDGYGASGTLSLDGESRPNAALQVRFTS